MQNPDCLWYYYCSQMPYVKSTHSEDMSLQQGYHYNIYKTSLSSMTATLLATYSCGSDATIWISSLPWWKYFYWTQSSIAVFSYCYKLHSAGKPQMRAICTYVGCTKATTNNQDIRPSVTVKSLFANISWTAKWIHTIELTLESAHQYIYNNIWCISKW